MRVHRIATATMVVLAMGGWTGVGFGTAFAGTGPDGVKSKARAEGGSSMGGSVFEQTVAQSARQNNNCNNFNSDGDVVTFTGGRVTGRCVTSDGSLTAFSRIHTGPAHAQGGSGTRVAQQNVAQKGRQNNNCNSPNAVTLGVDGSRVEGRCTDQDFSFSKHTRVKGGGARAEGGSSATTNVFQQNIAQEGRQNDNCNNPNATGIIRLEEGSRASSRCGNKDVSFSKHTRVKGGGARAEGGNANTTVDQQNIAQEGRQNNNCANPTFPSNSLSSGRETSRCGNKDVSFSKHTRVKGGGARAEGGSSATSSGVFQQNIAQEGRQNNNCYNYQDPSLDVTGGGRETSRCGNKDASFSKHTRIKGGGARAEGGNANTNVDQQNIAQEGRQNNNCNNPNFPSTDLDAGRETSRCGNKDASFSKHTRVKGGGARAEGGSSATSTGVFQQNIAQEGRQNNNCNNFQDPSLDVTGGGRETSRCGNKDASFSKHTRIKGGGARAEGGNADTNVDQQNIAQEGRQNNNCNNRNERLGNLVVIGGGRVESHCGNKDRSLSRHTRIKGGGARAEGGSSATSSDVFQQNIAQEGRQNNHCNNPNLDADITVTGGRVGARCWNKDFSFNHKAFIKGGGARAEGGSTTGGTVNQQNIAQEGRQNNNCANPTFPDETIELSSSRSKVGCKTLDGSVNVHTADHGGGAKATGGSATADLFVQNTAQEGRQSSSCGNPNNLTLTTTDSRSSTRCTAVDRSTNIGSLYQ
ncbi:hypothetical protein [Streptomyces sp. NPDC051776]|uniref:hypothetical protein n=1 Tax=Streptomyces sp. NPDC051776 TaxID=3155414 RepID=UPI00343F7D14